MDNPLNQPADRAVDLLARVLRGERGQWPSDADAPSAESLLKAAQEQGVVTLVYQQLVAADDRDDRLSSVRDCFGSRVKAHVVLEQCRRQEIKNLLTALAQDHVPCLLLKGTPLAYTLYRTPSERPRCDTDVLIPADRCEAALETLLGYGYRRSPTTTGKLITHQCMLTRSDDLGIPYTLDVHWKLSNPLAFADVLVFDELHAERIAVPALGPHADTLSLVHALLYACIHLAAHHSHDSRLIWLYDIHLLMQAVDRAELERFARLALERRVAAVCLAGVRAATETLGTRVPDGFLADLGERVRRHATEETARFLRSDWRRIDQLRSDWSQLDWSGRRRLLREHAFPPSRYMLERYGVTRRYLLPVLYTHRIVSGAASWFRRPLERR